MSPFRDVTLLYMYRDRKNVFVKMKTEQIQSSLKIYNKEEIKMKNQKHKRNFRRFLSLLMAVLMVVTSCNWSLVVRAEQLEEDFSLYEQDEEAEEIPGSYGQEKTEAMPVGELVLLREESSKQFLMSDGTVSLVQYETDVHYQDEAGEWQEIDN